MYLLVWEGVHDLLIHKINNSRAMFEKGMTFAFLTIKNRKKMLFRNWTPLLVFDRMFRKKRRVNSMSDLPSSRNNPSNLRRRNSISYDDVQSYERWRQQDDLNQSRSTSLSTKKYSMYTGLSPKEKIEYNDYHDVRYAYNIDKNAKI